MESIDTINTRLKDFYGATHDTRANWRLAWSEDQYEVRYGTYPRYSPSGIYLGEETGYRQVPKYRQWMPNQWVLEYLFPVPENSEIVVKLSYEPIWGFKNLEPEWEVVKILVDSVLESMGRTTGVTRYKEDEIHHNTKEAIEERVRVLEKTLFQDDDGVATALHHREAVVVP